MRTVLVIMTGIGFTLGVVFGLLLQLPIDNTLPADSPRPFNHRLSSVSSFRSRRSLSEVEEKLQRQQLLQSQQHSGNSAAAAAAPSVVNEKVVSVADNGSQSFEKPEVESNSVIDIEREATSNSVINSERDVIQSEVIENRSNQQNVAETQIRDRAEKLHNNREVDLVFENEPQKLGKDTNGDTKNKNRSPKIVSVRLNLQGGTKKEIRNKVDAPKRLSLHSPEDASYMATIVNGAFWTPLLEKSCPKPFYPGTTEAWRMRARNLDIVKMEEGCGRMQNRLLTFRDSSKACARYRLNTDQIQGEIFSYYLARLLNITNIPPTVLVKVDALAQKWRTVHLHLSLAQWADSKLVVLTQHIEGLSPAHIPPEFQEDGRRLAPTLAGLGSKSHSELCELVQWSDLIVFDYLTANLDRVINNMFNRQWNDQMMNSPAHNLERLTDGSLVFLDNESGLFHGYRLLDKYADYHKSLLSALCVFRPSTAEAVKRLHQSNSIGQELHKLFSANEALHEFMAAIPEKNVKILQRRFSDVYEQIVRCERLFNR